MLLVLASTLLLLQCTAASSDSTDYDYSMIFSPSRDVGIKFEDLPGFTRSVYERDHALITPESRVWAGMAGWSGSLTAHFISAAKGANFAMYLADMKGNATTAAAAPGVERFVLVLDGSISVPGTEGGDVPLHANEFVYFPPGSSHSFSSASGAGLLVYERKYAVQGGSPVYRYGGVDAQEVLPCAGEVFVLRKLLPQSGDYDFNVHVMDFKPGEFLNIKEVHYNQHGLLLLQGKGIYRLGDKWYPVQAGDAIWMAPYVPQWYAALGATNTRYVIYKDTTVNPLFDA